MSPPSTSPLPVQLLTPRQGATPALMGLLVLGLSQPFLIWHAWWLAGWLDSPGFGLVARREVVLGLYGVLLAAVVGNSLLALWLWPRRQSPAPQPRAARLVALVQAAAFTAMGLVYGPLTSPINTLLVTALVIGLALLGRGPALAGLLLALVVLVATDLLVLAGVLPYAPALRPATFSGGHPAAWWGEWQTLLFVMAMILGAGFTLLIFNRLDEQRERLEELSRTDGLTGLSNRRHFMERLLIEKQRRDRYHQPFCLVLCDADLFKRVNDTWGHHAGDEVLTTLGRLLNSGLRMPGDVAARLGGEEFALLLTDCHLSEARIVCERLRRQLAACEFGPAGRRFQVTLSMGLLECGAGGIEAALRAADANLYQAKREGRNRVVASLQEALP